jgi:hypothetical protein
MRLNTNYYTWTDTSPKPTAHIARSKNRLKCYDNTVYLKDGSNFEIELYNPTQFRVLAKIHINGLAVSAGGIVVNPGQRVFLERFIDEDRKFEFSTYWVGRTEQDKAAIEKNGLVEIFFHQEIGTTNTWGPYWGGSTSIPTNFWYYNTLNTTSASNNVSLLFDSSVNSNTVIGTPTASTKRTETGRVERGEKSDQVLETVHGNFAVFAIESCRLKIMPESEKAVEAGEIRSYCPGCGTRVKKSSWKFCPGCGTNLND